MTLKCGSLWAWLCCRRPGLCRASWFPIHPCMKMALSPGDSKREVPLCRYLTTRLQQALIFPHTHSLYSSALPSWGSWGSVALRCHLCSCAVFGAGTVHVQVTWGAGLCDATRNVVFPILLLDPDMGAGFRVHEIPFQFNLMKLLPRCQQVEMFFLMLTKGKCLFTAGLLLSSLPGFGHPTVCAYLPGKQLGGLLCLFCSSQLCSLRAVQIHCFLGMAFLLSCFWKHSS